MNHTRTYLDHNATSPLRPEAVKAAASLGFVGNPSSIHAEGRRARALVESARARIAAQLGAAPGEVILTSGASEANATVLRPGSLRALDGRPVERLLIGGTEHASILGGHRFPSDAVSLVRVDSLGRVDAEDLRARLSVSDVPTLVTIQIANGETGVIQPIREIAALVHEAGAVLHADAAQAFGRMPLDMAAIGVDAMSVSGHKLGGPAGIGALVLLAERVGPEAALLHGGGQQNGFRAGTENVLGIAGFAAASEAALANLAQDGTRLIALRDAAERVVRRRTPDAVVFGAGAPRLSNTLCFAVPGMKAETALMAFDLAGIAVSSGAACSSGKVGRSHVLAAMGVPEGLASGAIRLSFGWTSKQQDVERFEEAFASVLQRLYDRRPSAAA
ncbi:cysteine desulfurase family protein [Enterovirga rhinocerotis]|uniref:Cysteine desulfurase n=1 Tax=Enterovirga rhinocerotis TaxID=1339210 RepID=A0A4R7BRC9_9HYPH|nr:cysteine desulfurase family protein [Enterovirga rhinocerotis]TDR88234.1 cysteine desulfurase [Enterovirga rhinocerotis]